MYDKGLFEEEEEGNLIGFSILRAGSKELLEGVFHNVYNSLFIPHIDTCFMANTDVCREIVHVYRLSL